MKPVAKIKPRVYGGAPIGNQNAKKHGMNTLTRALKEAGIEKIDRRSTLGRELVARRQAIEADLGGRENLSQLQLDQINRYLYLGLITDAGIAFCLEQKRLVKRNRQFYPIVKELAHIMDSASKLAQSLGLKKIPKPVPSLQEYLASKEDEAQEEEPDHD